MIDLVHSHDGRSLSRQDVAFGSFREMLDARRSDPAIFLSYYSKGRKIRDVSFSSFHGLTFAHARMLRASGHVHAGRPVMVVLGDTLEAFVSYASILVSGAIVIPVDPSESPDYVDKVGRLAGATAVVTTREWSEKLSGRGWVCLEPSNLREESSAHESLDSTLGDPATVFFTSGTTGDAKGVLQSIGSAFANAEGTRRAGHLTKDDVLASCLPLYHVNAFNFSFILPLYLGCRITYMDGFTPAFWRVVGDENVTVASLSPPVLRLLLQDKREARGPRSLRYVISASSALHHSDIRGLRERFGVRVCQAYGLSETVNFTLFTPPDLSESDFATVTSATPLPPAGVPVWGQTVALMDDQGHSIESDDVPGEVVVRGWNVLTKYLNNPRATTEAFAGDWFHTGDVAFTRTLAGRRYFVLCGRVKETVKRSGIQIYLTEIDQAAREIGLENACAVGFDNDFTGEEIGLFLVRSSSETRSQEEILGELGKILSFAKTPKVVVEGDSIPRTAVGKIRRNELKRAFAGHSKTRFRHG